MSDEKKTRFGAIVVVANEFRFLDAVIGQLFKVCDRVALVRSTLTFAEPGRPRKLDPLPDALDPRVEVVQGPWAEGEARNAGIDFVGRDCDYVFTFDSDEIASVENLERLKHHIARGHRAVACYLETYWKTSQWKIDPPDRIPAAVIVRRDVRFRHMRVLDLEPNIVGERLVHHLSYVRTDEEVTEKLRTYAHAHQIFDTWFEQIWKKWDDDNTLMNLHPINRSSFRRAVRVQSPDLQVILKEHGVA